MCGRAASRPRYHPHFSSPLVRQSVSQFRRRVPPRSPRLGDLRCGFDRIRSFFVGGRWEHGTKNGGFLLGERAMNGLFFFSDEATSSRSYVLRVETQDE